MTSEVKYRVAGGVSQQCSERVAKDNFDLLTKLFVKKTNQPLAAATFQLIKRHFSSCHPISETGMAYIGSTVQFREIFFNL